MSATERSNWAQLYTERFDEPPTVFINLLRGALGLSKIHSPGSAGKTGGKEPHNILDWAHHFAGDGNRHAPTRNSMSTAPPLEGNEHYDRQPSKNAWSMRDMKQRQRERRDHGAKCDCDSCLNGDEFNVQEAP